MKLAAAYVLLGMGLGLLIGYGKDEVPSAEYPPPIKPVPRVMADERVKLDTETCMYTKPAGRPTYTVVVNKGTTCVTILQ